MTLYEFYTENGGDYNEVFQRLPNEAMIRRFLQRFLEDTSYERMQDALRRQDWNAAFFAVHTLKGIAQNLGFSNLAGAAHDLTEALRGISNMPQEELVQAVGVCYQRLRDTIPALE